MVGLFVVGIVVIALITTFNMHEMTKDQGHWFLLAHGKPTGEGEMKLHVPVGMVVTMLDGPKQLPSGRMQDWNEWIADHLKLVDGKGADIKLRRITHTTLIDDREAGNPEFFLEATVMASQPYVFDYIPVATGADVYRLEYTAPNAAEPPERMQFNLQ
jgi:hypothetical protein